MKNKSLSCECRFQNVLNYSARLKYEPPPKHQNVIGDLVSELPTIFYDCLFICFPPMHSLAPPRHSHVCEVLISWLRHCHVSSAAPGACWAVLELSPCSCPACLSPLPKPALESAATHGTGCCVWQSQTKINTIFKALLTRRSQKCCSRRCGVQRTFSLVNLPSFHG